MTSKESRDRIAGNSAWYRFLAKRSKQMYRQRDLKRALDPYIKCQTRDLQLPGKVNSEKSTKQYPRKATSVPKSAQNDSGQAKPKRGEVIHSIAQRLAPFDLNITQPEHFLRVDVRALKPRENAEMNSAGIAGLPSTRRRNKMPTVRCKCEITIWNLSQREKPQVSRFVQLLRDSQHCTIAPFAVDGSVSAAIHLDEAFYIKASKLLVPVRSDDSIRYVLSQTYRLQISLQPLVYSRSRWQDEWPPVPVQLSETNNLDDMDPLPHLDAKMEGFPVTPVHGSLFELKYEIHNGKPKLDTRYALEVEALWTKPQPTSTTTPPSINSYHALGAVSNTMRSYATNARVRYAFPLGDPLTAETRPNIYETPGYICPFCHNRDLQTSTLLQFHLVTDHDLFDFSFSERREKNRMTGPVDLLVEVSDASGEGAYDEYFESETWLWVKPQHRMFSLKEYLKGDDSWITGKKRKKFRDDNLSLQKHLIPVSQRQERNLVIDLPKKVKKKYRVPQAVQGGAFFSTLTRRVLREGEMLDESDEDIDESWIKRKHASVIDSFTDLSETEKKFIKKWDEYIFEERILANRYVGDALIRFTSANRVWLNGPGMLKEFFRHATKLLLCNGISHSVVQKCIQLVRSTDENDVANHLTTEERTGRYAQAGGEPSEDSNDKFGSHQQDVRDERPSASSDAMDLDD